MKTPHTESYLSTGNRSQFNNHTVTALFGGSRAGVENAST
ncbi:outer membrane protein [Gluconobacter japonicus]|nr:outer membrane protein [Gluconobacter japonicus]